MLKHLQSSFFLLVSMTLVTGGLYPLGISVLSQFLFREKANGSLVVHASNVVGSQCVGQSFTRPDYFWGRLSATSAFPYNASASGGSNWGPMNPSLLQSVEQRRKALLDSSREEESVPIDLVTSSASGLDPHISPAAALFQIPRVSKARGLSEDRLLELVERHTEDRQFGILGEPRVNVLMLNLALDQLSNDSNL